MQRPDMVASVAATGGWEVLPRRCEWSREGGSAPGYARLLQLLPDYARGLCQVGVTPHLSTAYAPNPAG
eukprot:352922-Chlamydomonas_euryale.AAC.3